MSADPGAGPAEDIRSMHAGDIDAVDDVWQEAFAAIRAASPEPPTVRTPESIASDRARYVHLLRSDPAGAFVAEVDGQVVGFSQAHVREATFVLAMLAVRPEYQDRHLGRALLDAALAYGADCEAKYIFSSSDPRALHRYVQAGFRLHPCIGIVGREPQGLSDVPELRVSENLEADLELLNRVDRARRRSARPEDFTFWRDLGDEIVIDDRGAYAVIANGRLITLSAESETLARSLLRNLFSGYPSGNALTIGFVAGEQTWAIETAADCRATLRPQGAMMTAGLREVPVPHLPSGMFA